VRFKYACKACEDGVKTTPLPPHPIPKSNASAGLLAHICTAKFMDALPLHRQEKIFARLSIHLPRATLARWMIRSGQ
jgi:transposase